MEQYLKQKYKYDFCKVIRDFLSVTPNLRVQIENEVWPDMRKPGSVQAQFSDNFWGEFVDIFSQTMMFSQHCV